MERKRAAESRCFAGMAWDRMATVAASVGALAAVFAFESTLFCGRSLHSAEQFVILDVGLCEGIDCSAAGIPECTSASVSLSTRVHPGRQRA
jgi:hypothetical protein